MGEFGSGLSPIKMSLKVLRLSLVVSLGLLLFSVAAVPLPQEEPQENSAIETEPEDAEVPEESAQYTDTDYNQIQDDEYDTEAALDIYKVVAQIEELQENEEPMINIENVSEAEDTLVNLREAEDTPENLSEGEDTLENVSEAEDTLENVSEAEDTLENVVNGEPMSDIIFFEEPVLKVTNDNAIVNDLNDGIEVQDQSTETNVESDESDINRISIDTLSITDTDIGSGDSNKEPDVNQVKDDNAGDMKSQLDTEVIRKLEDPNPEDCLKRPSHFSLKGHGYFYSDDEAEFSGVKVDWLGGRNICRRFCMDLVSLETPKENDLIKDLMTTRDIPYIWTSGRLCNFKGCAEREDLQPASVAGWFWSGSGIRMAPTNSTPPFWPYQPWSHTGHRSQFEERDIGQPDNAEFLINGNTEACMAIFNDIYEDGVAWHDAACYHKKFFICEDNKELLEENNII